MMNQPIVSIIIPVYNRELFIEKCLDSICKQSFSDIEILIINDGSTDKSLEIIEKFKTLDNRIRIINQENKGIARTRNIGVDETKAPYITFVDSDDWAEPLLIEKLYTSIIENDADIAVCKHFTDYKNRTILPTTTSDDSLVIDKGTSLDFIMNDKIISSHPWGKMYKKEMFKGVTFPKERLYEDYAVLFRVFANAEKVVIINEPLYHYVQHENSIIHTTNATHEYDYFLAEKDRYQFITENPNYFKDMESLKLNTVKNITRALKKTLHFTKKGESKKEISEIRNYLKQLTKDGVKGMHKSRYFKMKVSIYYPNAYRKFLKLTKDNKNYHKL